MRSIESALSHTNTSHLETEDDYLQAAEDYLAEVLVRIGEELAAAVWDRCSEGLEEAPFTRPEKRDAYIRRAGAEFEKKASLKTRQFYQDQIAECLRRSKGRKPPTLASFSSKSHINRSASGKAEAS